MTSVATPPSTVDGIKRLAKSIKRERHITHSEALNQAAKVAGFENYRHAQRTIANALCQQNYPVFLTAYWRDRSKEARGAGRETLKIGLPRALSALITRHQVERARNLAGFRMEYDDHLEMRSDASSQALARKQLEAALRTLRFMVATSLLPSTTRRQYESMQQVNELPGRDHLSYWIDPTTGDWLVLDEPYDHVTGRIAERHQWSQAQGLHIAAPQWEGLYNPGQCLPYFISPNANLLKQIEAKVEAMSKASEPAVWTGESSVYFSEFVSPERAASGKERKRRPGPSYSERMGATPYGGAPGYPSRWRPTKPMPIESHMTIGKLLRGLVDGSMPRRATDKLGRVRSELEDWALAEHGEAITQEMFHNMYYGDYVEPFQSQKAKLDAIDRVRAVLRANYAECKPRRDMLAALEVVGAAI